MSRPDRAAPRAAAHASASRGEGYRAFSSRFVGMVGGVQPGGGNISA
jgi:hypothetical protein